MFSYTLIWFDLSVYYDLSSVQIQTCIIQIFKKSLNAHRRDWLHYEIDYVGIDANWLHLMKSMLII